MRKILHRFWLWLRVIWTGKMSLKEIANDVKNTVKPKPYNPRRGRVYWDGRLGTYRHNKIGRNVPCPCGAMRISPADTLKPMKSKLCCRKGS